MDDETKLTLHGLQQYYVKLKDNEKNRKLFDLLDLLEFNQVRVLYFVYFAGVLRCWPAGQIQVAIPPCVAWSLLSLDSLYDTSDHMRVGGWRNSRCCCS